MSELIMPELKRLAKQPVVVAAILVLLIAALTLNAATSYLKLYFKKLPILPAKNLATIPLVIANKVTGQKYWVCVSKDEALPPDLAETLGTERFIFRDYMDVSNPELAELATRLQGKSEADRRRLLEEIKIAHPESVVNLAVTYYTGKADTVAHIPDRCYIADGYEPSEYTIEKWDVKTKRTPDGKVEVRFINFEDQAGNAQVTRNVAYFFHCNGSYESSPAAVRFRLQNLREKYGYYAKVEIMMQWKDRQKAAAVMTRFLTDMLPEIESVFPDWNHRPK